MITDVPNGQDFRDSGVGFLNLAWDNAIAFALDEEWIKDCDEENVESVYWKKAHRPLATALAMAQQGVDFLLKARIADVSPFLLIDGGPSQWPKGSHQSDVPFSEFRTIDAQDLIRAHDAVASQRLPDQFKTNYEKLRRFRNSIFHTVDKSVAVLVTDVLLSILQAINVLVGEYKWPRLRRQYIEDSPLSVAVDGDFTRVQVNRELSKVIDLLKPAQVKDILGFNKHQRAYICYECILSCREYGHEGLGRLAQLRPNTPTSTTLYCLACENERTVIRKDCKRAECKGNVLDAEDKCCLTCFD